MNLTNLKPAKGATHHGKRIARGEGSRGGTSTRGNKGAQSNTGYHTKRGFEGGQMPLHKRIPKYGFTNPHRVEYLGINLDTLQKLAEELGVKEVDMEFYKKHGLVSGKNKKIKILGRGAEKFNKPMEITAHAFSESAKSAIESKKGKIIVSGKLIPVEKAK
jgi:large subunit ribosomal protein L15